MKILLFLSVILFSLNSFSQVLVVEIDDGTGRYHIDHVAGIACDSPTRHCKEVFLPGLDEKDVKVIRSAMNNLQVVNMSFGFEPPELNMSPSVGTGFDYDKKLEDYESLKGRLEKLITDYSDVLFTVAAGNGKVDGPPTSGLPVNVNEFYPASFEYKNILSVAALDTDHINFENLDDYKIEKYSNYSSFAVDIATLVEKDPSGNKLVGTSFAAPYVTRIANDLRKFLPFLSAHQIKEIMMKSSYVQKIDKAIAAELDYLNHERKSNLFIAQSRAYKTVRDKAAESLGGIMLVKSGGPFVEEVAYQCADNFRRAQGLLSITQACLQAHEDRLSSSKERQEKLKQLWKLRNI